MNQEIDPKEYAQLWLTDGLSTKLTDQQLAWLRRHRMQPNRYRARCQVTGDWLEAGRGFRFRRAQMGLWIVVGRRSLLAYLAKERKVSVG
jgi:hypothetical protein